MKVIPMPIQEDYKRFCGLHSWYKHITLAGKDYYVYLAQGQQPRNGVCPEVDDPFGLHWHFSTRPPNEPVESFKVRFGPFLRGIEGYWKDEPLVNGFHIIVYDAGTNWHPWIQEKYPHLAHIDDWRSPYIAQKYPRAVEEIYKTECAQYWEDVLAHGVH